MSRAEIGNGTWTTHSGPSHLRRPTNLIFRGTPVGRVPPTLEGTPIKMQGHRVWTKSATRGWNDQFPPHPPLNWRRGRHQRNGFMSISLSLLVFSLKGGAGGIRKFYFEIFLTKWFCTWKILQGGAGGIQTLYFSKMCFVGYQLVIGIKSQHTVTYPKSHSKRRTFCPNTKDRLLT